jgi:hypothetical protein
MLPVILAAVGGYLIYDSLKSEKYADGGMMDDNDELKEYLYNFKGGGWNSISAHNKTEAIKLAKARHKNINKSNFYAGPKLEVDESTFRIKTEKDYKNLMSQFYADGGEMAKDGEISDFKKRVKERYGKDGMYAENFSPEPTSKEIDKAVRMFLDWTDSKQKKFNPKDTTNVAIVGDIMLYNRGEAFYNLGNEKIVKEVLKSVRR